MLINCKVLYRRQNDNYLLIVFKTHKHKIMRERERKGGGILQILREKSKVKKKN